MNHHLPIKLRDSDHLDSYPIMSYIIIYIYIHPLLSIDIPFLYHKRSIDLPFSSPLTSWLGALRQGLRQGGRREAVGAGGDGMTFPRVTGSSPALLLRSPGYVDVGQNGRPRGPQMLV